MDAIRTLAQEISSDENTESLVEKLVELKKLLSNAVRSYTVRKKASGVRRVLMQKTISGFDSLRTSLASMLLMRQFADDLIPDAKGDVYLDICDNLMKIAWTFDEDEANKNKICPLTGEVFNRDKLMSDFAQVLSDKLPKRDEVMVLLRLRMMCRSENLKSWITKLLGLKVMNFQYGLAPAMRTLVSGLDKEQHADDVVVIIDAMFTLASLLLWPSLTNKSTGVGHFCHLMVNSNATIPLASDFPVGWALERINSLSDSRQLKFQLEQRVKDISAFGIHNIPIKGGVSPIDMIAVEYASAFGFLTYHQDGLDSLMSGSANQPNDWLKEAKVGFDKYISILEAVESDNPSRQQLLQLFRQLSRVMSNESIWLNDEYPLNFIDGTITGLGVGWSCYPERRPS